MNQDKVNIIEFWQRVPKAINNLPVKRQIELIDVDVKHIDPDMKCVSIQGSVSRSVAIKDVVAFINL